MERIGQRDSRSMPAMRGGSPRYRDLATPERWFGGECFLAADVYETENAFVIRMDVPGLAADELKITRVGDSVTVEGEVKREPVDEGSYLFRERTYGTFRRSFVLPEVAESDVDATLDAGILTLEFAKRPEKQARSIKVKSAQS